MPLRIAEYLGQRVHEALRIRPVGPRGGAMCPFMSGPCTKLAKGQKPICSVRKTDGTLWIVCKDRLCSTKRRLELHNHQRATLFEIAKTLYGNHLNPSDVLVRREVPIPRHTVGRATNYHADYVMYCKAQPENSNAPVKVVLEMQGGGETSNTGRITEHVHRWETMTDHRVEDLAQSIDEVGTIETNAWRRQQEQFLYKGNVATRTGGGMVFCVGSTLYSKILESVPNGTLQDLRRARWTLALIGFKEREESPVTGGPIPLQINPEQLLFTDYGSFVRAIADQGAPALQIFHGEFVALNGQHETI